MRVAVPVALVSTLGGCQIIGGYAAYDVVNERFLAVSESHATSNHGMWCPNIKDRDLRLLKQTSLKPKRKNLRHVNVPIFEEPRIGRVTDEKIGWREYRRGTFFECSDPAKDKS